MEKHNKMSFQLTSVNISWCELMTQSGVSALSNGCKKLTTFISKVSWPLFMVLVKYDWISPQGCPHIGDEAMYNLARSCPYLEDINVQGCRNITVSHRVSQIQEVKCLSNVQDEGLAAICEGCPNIRYLCISNCPHLTDQTLVRAPCLSNSSL